MSGCLSAMSFVSATSSPGCLVFFKASHPLGLVFGSDTTGLRPDSILIIRYSLPWRQEESIDGLGWLSENAISGYKPLKTNGTVVFNSLSRNELGTAYVSGLSE